MKITVDFSDEVRVLGQLTQWQSETLVQVTRWQVAFTRAALIPVAVYVADAIRSLGSGAREGEDDSEPDPADRPDERACQYCWYLLCVCPEIEEELEAMANPGSADEY